MTVYNRPLFTETDTLLEWLLLYSAWVVALLATLGAIFIGEVVGQEPCVLCWFQRAFMFPLAVILGVACYLSDMTVWKYALPVAAIGWALSIYHALLYWNLIPQTIQQCGVGPSCSGADMLLFGQIPIPALSVAGFTLIVTLLLLVRREIGP